MLLLVPTALGHVPHDDVVALAAPADLSDSVPWLLVLGTYPSQELARSDDAGQSWTLWGGAPLVDELVGAAVLRDGTWVLASSTRLWRSEDEGVTWDILPVNGVVLSVAADGGQLLVAADTGLWAGDPDTLSLVVEAPILKLQPGETPAVLTEGAGIWAGDDGEWRLVAKSPPGATSVAAAPETLFVGTSEGAVKRWEGAAWQSCARPDLGLHPGIERLATDGAALLASDGDTTWTSDVSCTTWSAGSPLETSYDTAGGMLASAEAAAALFVSGGRAVHAGWDGLARFDENTWFEPVIVPPDYTRGLTFTDTGVLLWGTYAAGVARTDDGGRSFTTTTGDFGIGNVQRLQAAADEVVAVSGHVGWQSDDGGDSWGKLSIPFASVAELYVDREGGRFTAFSDAAADEAVVSEDQGATWAVDDALTTALAGSAPRARVRLKRGGVGVTVVVGARPSRVVVKLDGETTWRVARTGNAESSVTHGVGWPQDAPERVVYADDEGVHASVDGTTWSTWNELGDDRAEQLGVAGDLLFLASGSGELWRSRDGGETWSDLAARLPAHAHAIVASPFAPDAVLFATTDGLYTLDDPDSDAPALQRALAYQRVDDATGFVTCEGCDAAHRVPEAGLGQLTPLGENGRMTTQLRGTSVRVIGTRTSEAVGSVLVDGVTAAQLAGDALSAPGTLAEVTGLSDGWHVVSLQASATGLEIDAVEATGEGGFLSAAEPEGCGCESGRAPPTGLLLLAAASHVGRRLRRGA